MYAACWYCCCCNPPFMHISADLPETGLALLLEKLTAQFPGCEITVY